MDTNYMQVVEMTDEEKLKMYLKEPKEKIAKMLIECNKIIGRLQPQVIAKTAGIEFRPNIDNIDEIVTDNCRLHLEYMDNDLIWIDIELPNGDEYHINIYHKDEKCHKHLKTSGEKVG